MVQVKRALEAALHEMSFLNGLRVTDIPDAETTMVIDTRDTARLIEEAIKELERKDKPKPFLFDVAAEIDPIRSRFKKAVVFVI